MFLLNSRPAFFSAPPKSFTSKWLHPPGGPFSQSYRALLSSSLAEVISSALGLLSQPTSGGLRYGRPYSITTKLFSSAWVQQSFVSRRIDSLNPLLCVGVDLPAPTRLQERTHHVQWARSAYLSASPLCFKTKYGWCRNFDLLSIACALRPRLRTD